MPFAAASTRSRRTSEGETASGQSVQEPSSNPLNPCSTASSIPRCAVHSGPNEYVDIAIVGMSSPLRWWILPRKYTGLPRPQD